MSFCSVSGDGSVLFGTAPHVKSSVPVPCYWTVAGYQYFCTAFVGDKAATPTVSNKTGTIIAGIVQTGAYLPGYGPVTKTFRWDTSTNTVTYILPPEYQESSPSFVSPDGTLIEFGGWLNPGARKSNLVDFSTPTEQAKGPQDIGTWLVNHGFVSAADAQGNSGFIITGMSDDGRVLVGCYTDINGGGHNFIAYKPVVIGPVPVGALSLAPN